MRLGAFIGGLLMGGLAGAALGVLAAPKSGSQLREELAEASEGIYRKAVYELEELTTKVDELRGKVEEVKDGRLSKPLERVASAVSAVKESVQDFSPSKRIEKVEHKIEQVQEAMHDAEATIEESQHVLERTETPVLRSQMESGDTKLDQAGAEELAQNMSTQVKTEAS